MNMGFGLFPKDLDHSAEVGWLLYSTRAQDEERIAAPV
jgi:hypothetical protein